MVGAASWWGAFKVQASEILRTVENAGGALWVTGESLGYRIPESESSLLDELRTCKWELLDLLRERPPMPAGVRLVSWEPVSSPVKINRWLTVLDTDKFIRVTLEQIDARLNGIDWKAGNWTLSELIERLDAVGISIALANDRQRLQ
jgi:hypothetical protein